LHIIVNNHRTYIVIQYTHRPAMPVSLRLRMAKRDRGRSKVESDYYKSQVSQNTFFFKSVYFIGVSVSSQLYIEVASALNF